MFGDDIFDGWLTMSTVGSFLDETPQPQPKEPDPKAPTQTPLPSKDAPIENSSSRKRRGHTKSRLGCITCKRRKIKCQEQWPSCANCIKRGCPCRYPTVFKHTQHDRIVSEVMSGPRQLVRLSDTPIYTANDMRLFHHFLTAAHPCIPHEYEGVWVTEIPAFSHQYEYLMHAMLGLSGSHLSLFIDDPMGNRALSHRQKAITGLEEAFSRWPPKAEEAHVMLACCYLLAFQSGFIPDGFFDHIVTLRGCALLSQLILTNRFEGTFSMEPNMANGFILTKLRSFPTINQMVARETLRSLASFLHILDEPDVHKIERAVYASLVETVHPLLTPTDDSNLAIDEIPAPDLTEETPTPPGTSEHSPFCIPSPAHSIKNPLFPEVAVTREPSISYEEIKSWGVEGITSCPSDREQNPARSFNALMSSISILATWPQEEITHLISPTNKLGNVLMINFFTCRFIVAPLTAPESSMRTPIKAMVEWCEKVLDGVEDDETTKWTEFVKWPQLVVRTLRCCLNQKRGLTFGDVYKVLVDDPGAFLEGRVKKL